ncbi:Uroplakin-2 [Labeo rohita]|uniref:Uroplakin-2 n=1 Tax=Labeo rohita TaxID=84645 RepID=A0ABQ8MN55_LABRO|nr:uroplakin-2 [Labeo rohita]KAI2664280.1 Uroplakin-2 [Labeo rohita]
MLAVLFILGMLCPLNSAEIPIKLLDPTNDGVVANVFPNAFLLRWPDCTLYGNRSAGLVYTELPTNDNKTQIFTVPSCTASLPGLLLQNLKNGTTYIMEYKIEGTNQTSANLTATTTNALAYEQIDSGLERRSGAMVVITVILSLAMVILLVGLIISIFFS